MEINQVAGKQAKAKHVLGNFGLKSGHNLVLCGVLLCIMTAIFSGCHSGQLYKRYIVIPDGVWNRGDRIRFVVPVHIKKPTKVNVELLLRYTDIYEYNNIMVAMHLALPTQTVSEQTTYDFPMKLPNGANAGKGLGDIWDIKLPLLQNYILKEPGNYTFDFEHNMTVEQLPFITEVGLLIEDAE